MHFESSPLFIYACILTLLALGLWLIVRLFPQSIFLPILRIRPLRRVLRPQLKLQAPPWLPFFFFLVAASLMLLQLLRPHVQEKSPLAMQKRSHLFIDLSPSVSAHRSDEELRSLLLGLWEQLGPAPALTLSSSADPSIRSISTREAFAAELGTLHYHRQGTRLGLAMKDLAGSAEKAEVLIIASDRDAHSWQGFAWQLLAPSSSLRFLDLSKDKTLPNLYIEKVSPLAAAGSAVAEWEISIARSTKEGSHHATLTLHNTQQELGSWPLSFREHEQRSLIRASVPKAALAAAAYGTAPLEWRLSPEPADAITLDNSYFSSAAIAGASVALVADPSGERSLEDPAHALQAAFHAVGLHSERYDAIPAAAPPGQRFWVLFRDAADATDPSSCPSWLSESNDRIWLSPYRVASDSWATLCSCALSLRGRSNSAASCQGLQDARALGQVLSHYGAQQIGGNMGEKSTAIGWHFADSSPALSVFTMPLRPSRETGLRHRNFPLVVRELLHAEKVLTSEDNEANNNVPLGESLLLSFDGEFPPQFSAHDADEQNSNEERWVAEPWVRGLAAALLLLLSCEVALALLPQSIWRRRPRFAAAGWLKKKQEGITREEEGTL